MRGETKSAVRTAIQWLQTAARLVREDTNLVISGINHVDVIRHFDSLRIAAEQIKEAREALQEITDHLSKEVVPDFMKRAGVKTITIEGVGRCTVSYRYSCSMIDKDLGLKWLRENGHGGLIQPTVNAQTLGAFAKDLLEVKGEALPDDIFKTGTAPYTSITKVK